MEWKFTKFIMLDIYLKYVASILALFTVQGGAAVQFFNEYYSWVFLCIKMQKILYFILLITYMYVGPVLYFNTQLEALLNSVFFHSLIHPAEVKFQEIHYNL